MSIKLENITKKYGNQLAVDNVSFTVEKGEIAGFLGPNGAGKTTTIKIITSYIPPTSGEVEVCDLDVIQKQGEIKKKIGYLPEHNPLYKEMYVREYLQFIARVHEIKNMNSRISDLIDMTGLSKESHKKIGALSKGYRQRVGLAQAMIHDPEVLILDEPTTGLDPNQLLEIRNLIRNLGREKTVLFSSHIMQEVQAICDRVLIINNGKLVADDSIDMLAQYQNDEMLIYVEFNEPPDLNELLKIPGILKVKQRNKGKLQLISDKQKDVRKEIFDFAVRNNLILLELRKEDYSMEDVFQKLTLNQ